MYDAISSVEHLPVFGFALGLLSQRLGFRSPCLNANIPNDHQVPCTCR